MIQKTKSYQTSDNRIFSTIPEAQEHELTLILADCTNLNTNEQKGLLGEVARHLLANADKVADILTTKGSSKPAARSINGGTKERKKKGAVKQNATEAPTALQPTLPGTAAE